MLPKRSLLTDNDINEIIAKYKNGATYLDLMTEYATSAETLRTIFLHYKVPIRSNGFFKRKTDAEIEKLVEKYYDIVSLPISKRQRILKLRQKTPYSEHLCKRIVNKYEELKNENEKTSDN